MIFNDIDLYREALKKCNLRESVMPISRGFIVEDVETYNKIQTMLNTPEMESAYLYLYSLDVEDLSESEVAKVNKLYETAIQRGIILEEEDEDDEEKKDKKSSNGCDIIGKNCPNNKVSLPAVKLEPEVSKPKLKMASFTVLYSAMKNGEIKTGETYSNAIDTRSAKADVLNKLMRAGYDHIEILAIEAGDPDASYDDLCNTDFGYPDDQEISDYGVDMLPNAFEDEEEAEEESSDEETDGEDSGDSEEEESSDEETEGEDSEEESSDDDSEEEDSEDEDSESDEDSEEEGDDEESDDEESDDEDSDDEELSKEEKTKYKDQYTKAFKAAMKECKFDKAFDDLTIEEKIKFFEKIQKEWDDDKPDPVKFMDPKEIEALNKEVIKKN